MRLCPLDGIAGAAPRCAALARMVAIVAALVVLAVPVASRAAEPVVVPPTGTTYNDLAVAWWQYALGQPAATNPLSDPTGANCANGQSGPVFFLTGTAGSGTITSGTAGPPQVVCGSGLCGPIVQPAKDATHEDEPLMRPW
jgi:hypothetical protein